MIEKEKQILEKLTFKELSIETKKVYDYWILLNKEIKRRCNEIPVKSDCQTGTYKPQ